MGFEVYEAREIGDGDVFARVRFASERPYPSVERQTGGPDLIPTPRVLVEFQVYIEKQFGELETDPEDPENVSERTEAAAISVAKSVIAEMLK